MSNCNTLSPTIQKNGFTYTKTLEGQRTYLYAQKDRHTNKTLGYEVFLKRIKPEREVFGKVFPKGEVFPNNEAFGKWAWSFYTIKNATQKFMQLEEKR